MKRPEPLGFDTPTDPSGEKSRPQFEVTLSDLAPLGKSGPSLSMQEIQLRLFEVCPVGHRLIYRDAVGQHCGGGLWSVFWIDGTRNEYHLSDLEVAARLAFSVVVDRASQVWPEKVGELANNIVIAEFPFQESDETNFPKADSDLFGAAVETQGCTASRPCDTFGGKNETLTKKTKW